MNLLGPSEDWQALFGGDPFGRQVQAPPIGRTPPFFPQPRNTSPQAQGQAGSPLSGIDLNQLGLLLLSQSGPSPYKRGIGQIIGETGLQARQLGQQSQQDELKRKYMEAQIRQLDEAPKSGQPVVVVGPDGKPRYASASEALGQEAYKGAGNAAEPPASLQELDRENESRVAKGLKPYSIEDWKRVTAQMVPKYGELGGVLNVLTPQGATPLGTLQAEVEAQKLKAGGAAAGKAETERYSKQVDTGLDAADALATVKRGVELLGEVSTGGIDAVKLKATNLFGVTGADEAELSANLGKAVLSQLRATFGAQFTEKEGARLAEIEAGFGKSTEGNKRLLSQAQKILERAARRGIMAAEKMGDSDTAQEIRDAMEFKLDSQAPKPQQNKAPQSAIDYLKAHPESAVQFKAKYGYLPGG